MDIAERIKTRLQTLGLNAFEVSRRAGLERGFVNDLLNGWKKGVRGHSLIALAEALDVDPAFLLGQTDEPRAFEPAVGSRAGATLPLAGQIEGGTWREVDSMAGQPSGLTCDEKWPPSEQLAFRVLGDVANTAGIVSGSTVGVVTYRAYVSRYGSLKEGALVVIRRDRAELHETTIRKFHTQGSGPVLLPASTNPKHLSIPFPDDEDETTHLLGVVVRAVLDLDA